MIIKFTNIKGEYKLKIKIGELNTILESLNKIIDKEISIKISYKISKLTKQLMNEYKLYEENRIRLINKYAERDEQGNIKINKEDNTIIILDVDRDKFNNEFIELVNIDIEIEFDKIRLDDLGDVMISPRDLLNLDFLFSD